MGNTDKTNNIMKTVFYYIILLALTSAVVIITAWAAGSIMGFKTVGVKGLTAGAGIYVLYSRKEIFAILDRSLKKKHI